MGVVSIDFIGLITSADFNRLSIHLKLVIINFRISANSQPLYTLDSFVIIILLKGNNNEKCTHCYLLWFFSIQGIDWVPLFLFQLDEVFLPLLSATQTKHVACPIKKMTLNSVSTFIKF